MKKIIAYTLFFVLFSPLTMADDLRTQIVEQNKKFMQVFGNDAKALAALYTEKGQVLAPGADVIEGHAAIASFWQGVFTAGIVNILLETIELTSLDNIAIEVGRFTLLSGTEEPVDRGKYMVVWSKDDGSWKLHRDIFNSSVPPAD